VNQQQKQGNTGCGAGCSNLGSNGNVIDWLIGWSSFVITGEEGRGEEIKCL